VTKKERIKTNGLQARGWGGESSFDVRRKKADLSAKGGRGIFYGAEKGSAERLPSKLKRVQYKEAANSKKKKEKSKKGKESETAHGERK